MRLQRHARGWILFHGDGDHRREGEHIQGSIMGTRVLQANLIHAAARQNMFMHYLAEYDARLGRSYRRIPDSRLGDVQGIATIV